jgi:hypothetical protein
MQGLKLNPVVLIFYRVSPKIFQYVTVEYQEVYHTDHVNYLIVDISSTSTTKAQFNHIVLCYD